MAAVSTPTPNHCRSRACRCLPNLWNSLQGATMVRLASPSMVQKKQGTTLLMYLLNARLLTDTEQMPTPSRLHP